MKSTFNVLSYCLLAFISVFGLTACASSPHAYGRSHYYAAPVVHHVPVVLHHEPVYRTRVYRAPSYRVYAPSRVYVSRPSYYKSSYRTSRRSRR
jgi:hypothetical protein